MAPGHAATFGAQLRHFRRALGLTQEALAERAGLSARAISALERGVNRAPQRATFAALARALELSTPERARLHRSVVRGAAPDLASSSPHDAFLTPGERAAAALPPVVGRDAEVARIARHLAGEGPAVLLIAGEPGMGKTRLLQAAVAQARGAGMATLEGGCQRRDGQEPFAPLVGAFADYLRACPPARRRGELAGCAWLARLLPELAAMGALDAPAAALPANEERRLMFRAAASWLANVAAPAGALLALDDLQWAESGALDLLLALARSAGAGGVRIIAAYRSTEVGGRTPLAAALADLAHAGPARPIALGPLSPETAEELLRHLVSQLPEPVPIHDTLRRAGGIPFFLVSCAHESRRAGPRRDGRYDVPWDIAQSVRHRVLALPVPALDLLDLAAVIGRRVPRDVLLAACRRLRLPRRAALAAIDACVRAGLLTGDGPDAYLFAHDLIREAIEVDQGPERLAELHRTVARTIEGLPSDPPVELLIHHYTRCGDRERAARYLERASQRAGARHAHAEAAGHLRALVAYLEGLGQPLPIAAAREQLGGALMTLGQYAAALPELRLAAAAYAAAGDADAHFRAAARIGELHVLRGTARDGVAQLRALLAGPRRAEPSARAAAQVYVALAWALNAGGQYREALATAERAARLAEAAGEKPLRVQAQLRRSQLLLMLDRLDDGAAVLRDVIALAEEAGDWRSLRLALNSAGWIHEARGEFERDRAYTERALAAAERLGDPTVIAFMRSNRGGPAFNLGEWAQARADFERGLAQMRALDPCWASAWPPLLLGQLCLAQGEWQTAEPLLAEAIAAAEAIGDLQALRTAHSALAERELLCGCPRAARSRLEPLLDRPGQRESDVRTVLPLLAWAHLELGETERAAALLAQGIGRATRAGLLPALADALRIRALLEQRRGRRAAAHDTLARALDLYRRLGAPYGAAKVHYALGGLYADEGRRDDADRHLRAARIILVELGERLYAEQVERGLAALAPEAGAVERRSRPGPELDST